MSEECLLHTDSLRFRLLCAGVLYSELPVVSWAITAGSLGVIVAVDCVLSPTDRGNGLASSSRPGGRERVGERGRGGEGGRGGERGRGGEIERGKRERGGKNM